MTHGRGWLYFAYTPMSDVQTIPSYCFHVIQNKIATLLRLIHMTCMRMAWLQQTVAKRAIRKFIISAKMQLSTSCKRAFILFLTYVDYFKNYSQICKFDMAKFYFSIDLVIESVRPTVELLNEYYLISSQKRTSVFGTT